MTTKDMTDRSTSEPTSRIHAETPRRVWRKPTLEEIDYLVTQVGITGSGADGSYS